jgi:hypothetical protein
MCGVCKSVSHFLTPVVPRWWYLLGLHNTPLCLWHCFICDSASRYYNLSLHWVQTPWCLVSGRSVDVLSSRRLADNSLTSRHKFDSSYSWLSQQHLRCFGNLCCARTLHSIDSIPRLANRCLGSTVEHIRYARYRGYNNVSPGRCVATEWLY